MTLLYNDPKRFVEEMVTGFVAANGRYVRRVDGGVVRRRLPSTPTVAVVIGGGSGHYPAFAGLVGPGIAHGAVMGNVFASPSADQAENVALNCQTGAGVLFSYGNYAGDVLNFDQAQQRLIERGIPCRTVTVTDDISSAPATDTKKRRGVAGDLAVFKVAGTAADQGRSLDEVYRLATKTNERCRSLGVAFAGCTLPGADHRLFEVPSGRMGVGMGVHGEPGISEDGLPSAAQLADLFITKLLEEKPSTVRSASGARVVVLLNGLGAVKYEELFVVYGRVASELARAGITVVDGRVGEFVTSLDMVGASMTLLWLDDELEHLWAAPAESPGFSKPMTDSSGADGGVPVETPVKRERGIPESTAESRAAAARLVSALQAAERAIDVEVEELGRIDAVAGDGDHGRGMQRGVAAAAAAAAAAEGKGAGVRTALQLGADAWANQAGGASGALWGTGLRALAGELSDTVAPDPADWARGVDKASAAIQAAGKAQLGDKTMLDAIQPFSKEFSAGIGARRKCAQAWRQATAAAARGAAETAKLVAKVGRARPHGQKSLGTADPGAVSFVIIVRAVEQFLRDGSDV